MTDDILLNKCKWITSLRVPVYSEYRRKSLSTKTVENRKKGNFIVCIVKI